MQEMYREYKSQVIHEGNLTEAFKVHSGVQQGCILSPTLFLIVMDDIMRRGGVSDGACMECQRIDYTDDVSLLSQRYADMSWKKCNLQAAAAATAGLKISTKKTNYA